MEKSTPHFIKPFFYRDFRFIYISEICFFCSAWMAAMVFGLIATHLKGNSPFYVGLIGFGFNLPMLFGPYIGVMIDRVQRMQILKIASLFSLASAIVMALLLMGHLLNFWLMFFLVLVYGISCAFYYPAIIASVNDIIDDPNVIGNGTSLINTTNRVAMFFGYSLGGFIVAATNEQSAFWINSVLFLLSVIAISLCTSTSTLSEKKQTVSHELKAGLAMIKNSKTTQTVIISLTIQGLLAWPYLFQIPIVNRYFLNGTPATLGTLLAVGGLGGTIAGIIMSARKTNLFLTKLFTGSNILLAISIFLLTLCRQLFWAYPIVFALDFALLMSLTVGIIFIQLMIPKEYLGRIMGIIGMVTFGTIPIGSVLFYGGIGEPFGIMTAFTVAAIIIFISVLWFAVRIKDIRQEALPIFIKKGLIQNGAQGYKI